MYRGLDVEKVAKGFYYAANCNLRELRAYLEERKDKEPVKFAPIYIDIIHKIDEYLKE